MQRDDTFTEHQARFSERRAVQRLIRDERKTYREFLARGDAQHKEWERAIYVCDTILRRISFRK